MDEKIDRLSKAEYEHRLMIKAVWYYYIENYTQQNISHLCLLYTSPSPRDR